MSAVNYVNDELPHICFLAPNAYPMLAGSSAIQFAGGAELQQVIIAKNLVQRGYSVSMICLDFGQDDIVEIDGIAVHRAFRQSDGLPVIRFFWPRLTSIWKCLKEVDADIYYHRSASMLTGVLAAFCRLKKKKSIFAIAGEPKIRFLRDRWLYQYGIKRVDRILVQNIAQQTHVLEAIGRVSVLIPNIHPGSCDVVNAMDKVVLWVGTIRRVKRPDLFLDIAEMLPDYRFIMVGGPDGRDSTLYDETRMRAALMDHVEFVGFAPYAEVGRYFDGAALFVNTSDSEGFPNTFLQSWARSVPTISFIDSGARFNGLSVGRVVNSVKELAETVTEFMENSSERKSLGDVCCAYVRTNHSADHIMAMYEELFTSVLAEHSTS